MEKSLILRGHIFGLDSVEVLRACKSVGEMCNYLAMSFLQQDLFDVTLELLKKAEVLTERHKAVRAVTYNNLVRERRRQSRRAIARELAVRDCRRGSEEFMCCRSLHSRSSALITVASPPQACYYRKRGKLRTALNFARKALGIEAKLSENVKSADTHLNMCTILSELKRHEKAIVHARIALKLLLMELFGNLDSIKKDAEEHELIATGAAESTAASMEALKQRLPADRVAVLAISYHNMAVQMEFLRRYTESLSAYEKAMKVVQTHLPPTHPLVQSLGASYAAARKKMEGKIAKQKEQQIAKPGKAAASTAGSKQSTSSINQQLAAAAPPQSSTAAEDAVPDDEVEYAEEAEGGFVSE